MEKLKSVGRGFFKAFDVFTSPVNLRYDKEPQYDTLTGGCMSFGLIVLLVSVFYSSWIDLLNKKSLFSNEETVREFDPSQLLTSTNEFMFAVGVIGVDLNSNDTRYFDLYMNAVLRDENRRKNKVKIPLTQCTIDQWSHFGPEFKDTFIRFQIEKFRCPPSNYTLRFEGKFTSANFSYLELVFKTCTGNDCKTQSEFNDYIANNKAFYLDFFFTNTLINKDQLIPIKKVFEDKNYLLISDRLGIDMNIYVSEFSMTTDNSLYPWIDQENINGLVVKKDDFEQWNYIPNNDKYCTVYVRKSDNLIKIKRAFRKIDDMLSYIGGLFGIIAVVFGLVVNYYSQCSFQLSLSTNIFQYHEQIDGSSKDLLKIESDFSPINFTRVDTIVEPKDLVMEDTAHNLKKEAAKEEPETATSKDDLDPSKFHFFDYLQYLLFIGLKKIGCKPKWKKMVMYDDTLDEMRNQMDINTLMQKMTFYDKAIHALFDEQQLKLLYLQEKFNIMEIKKEREMLNFGFQILNLFDIEKNGELIEASKVQGAHFNHQLVSKAHSNTHRNLLTQKQLGSRKSFSASHPFDILFQGLNKKQRNDSDIPDEILLALDSIHSKMEEGDEISKRIYEGIDPKLVKKYEKTLRKVNPKKIRMNKISRERISIVRNSSFMDMIGKNVRRIQ